MMRDCPLSYGRQCCDTVMKIPAEKLPPAGGFHYHQGVCLMGMQKIYECCGNPDYYRYIKEWVDSVLSPAGVPKKYHEKHFDDLMPGMLLFQLYDKEGDEKYKKALDLLVSRLSGWSRNSKGGFWHKEDETPNQVWLDGLFMYGPLAVNYAARWNRPEFFDLVAQQIDIMWDNMRDAKTGLLKHAWDPTGRAEWADSETGLSPEFWGRAMGWYCVALAEIYEQMPARYQKGIAEKEQMLIEALVKYQKKEDGMWYEVLDKNERSDNWPEMSCSCLFLYSICKAVRLGMADDSYLEQAKVCYDGVISMLETNEAHDLIVGHVCIGTGVGDYSYYINRPTSENDLHGIGAFLYMISEAEKIHKICEKEQDTSNKKKG